LGPPPVNGGHPPPTARQPTQPATPVFALGKTWRDPGPGIAMVQVHYTWTPPGGEPDWSIAEEAVLVPHPETPGLRSTVLEVPRLVGGSTDFSLHHVFFVVGGGARSSSPVFSEDIVARDVSYEDPTGELTSVGVVWNAAADPPQLRAPNYTATAMDGLTFQSPATATAPEPSHIYPFVRAQPLPHVFRAKVWGVRGSQVRYGYHLLRQGSPDPSTDGERWDDNAGDGWTVEL
jgi:hypothetical protein